MIKKYETVIYKETSRLAVVIDMDDNHGMTLPIYEVELVDIPDNASLEETVFWCGWDEIEEYRKDGAYGNEI